MLAQHPDAAIVQALDQFPGVDGAAVTPLGRGLINDTYDVRSATGHFVLQRVNPIFDPAIHHNIRAVTERLLEGGLPSPRLVLSRQGQPWLDLGESGIWRLQTFVEGAGFDIASSRAQARAAGELVARFHDALDGMDYRFVGVRLGVHDTAKHLATLRRAIREGAAHALYDAVAELGGAILARAARMSPLPALPPRVCHGDLKFNNVRFAAAQPPGSEQAVCLIDLDTVGPMELAHELGDAWRSWCNPGGEGEGSARFDLGLFEAAWHGYRDGCERRLSQAERRALLDGVEWISLELAARFAADALLESYFGWDATEYTTAGEHNLVRARSQFSLHQAVARTRLERAELLKVGADV